MSDADELVAKIRAIADEVEGTTASVTDKAQAAVEKTEEAVSKFRSLLQSITDNIAWIAGLPAVFGGGFGFLKSNADESAATDWQMNQLTERVAELESQNNLLGGDTKNWSINLGDAPGGSMTAAIVFVFLGVLIVGALWWQQKRRRP
jgi:methyl-accepting chemotaxis protein